MRDRRVSHIPFPIIREKLSTVTNRLVASEIHTQAHTPPEQHPTQQEMPAALLECKNSAYVSGRVVYIVWFLCLRERHAAVSLKGWETQKKVGMGRDPQHSHVGHMPTVKKNKYYGGATAKHGYPATGCAIGHDVGWPT